MLTFPRVTYSLKRLNRIGMSAHVAAYSAVFLSLLALCACGFFLPILMSKISTITTDLETVSSTGCGSNGLISIIGHGRISSAAVAIMVEVCAWKKSF